MSSGIILAVDPGASGGLAWGSFELTDVCPMPATEGDVLSKLRDISQLRAPGDSGTAFLETLVKHMGEGVPASTMAVYGSNYGFLKGCLMAMGWRVIMTRPQDWQAALHLGLTGRQKANVKGMSKAEAKAEKKRIRIINAHLKRDWKNKLKARAQELFPTVTVTLSTADALLLLQYGWLVMKGGLR